jgi:serine/threonine protein kinase
MHKYRAARDLCDKMAKRFPNDRPSCHEILAHKHSWALNDEEFDASKELKNVSKNNFNFIKDSIIYAFIIGQMIWYNRIIFRLCTIL